MEWLPVWVGEIYLQLISEFGQDRFTNQEAREALPEISGNTVNRALCIMGEKGWAFKAWRGLWYLAFPRFLTLERKDCHPELDELAPKLRRELQDRVDGAIIFGSWVLGTYDDYSDVDVLAIVHERKLLGIENDLLKKYGASLHLTSEPDPSNPFFWSLAFGHKIILDANGRAKSLVRGVEQYVEGKEIYPLFFTRKPVFYVGSQEERERLERTYMSRVEEMKLKGIKDGEKLNLLKAKLAKRGYEVPSIIVRGFAKLID